MALIDFSDRTTMATHTFITALAWLFGFVTLAGIAAVAWHFRRRPIVALIGANERRIAFHRDTLAALDAAIASARAEGKSAEADRLAPARAGHVRALANLAAAQEFARR